MRSAKKENPSGAITLDKIPSGRKVHIVSIEAGHGLKNRLAAMGLLINEQIEVVRNDRKGQVIIAVKGCKIVLGRGMSYKIFVQ